MTISLRLRKGRLFAVLSPWNNDVGFNPREGPGSSVATAARGNDGCVAAGRVFGREDHVNNEVDARAGIERSRARDACCRRPLVAFHEQIILVCIGRQTRQCQNHAGLCPGTTGAFYSVGSQQTAGIELDAPTGVFQNCLAPDLGPGGLALLQVQLEEGR